MPRSLTTRTWQALLSQETMDAFVLMLTISIKDGADWKCIYLTNNRTDIVSTIQDGSNPQTYISFPFQIFLPPSEPGKISSVNLSVTNVSRELIDAIRALQEPPVIGIYVINAAEPDVVVAKYLDYVWRQLNYDASTITGTISLEDYLSQSYPSELMGPSNFPGLFS